MQEFKIDNFDTFILDLDSTVWLGIEPTFWAKKLKFPIKKERQRVYDKDNNYIELTNGISEFLKQVNLKNKRVGFLTRGALLDVEYEQQPPILCLKEFNIYSLFNYENHAIYKTQLKSNFLKPYKQTIFIDDNPTDLKDIKDNFPQVTTMNRNLFNDWRGLI